MSARSRGAGTGREPRPFPFWMLAAVVVPLTGLLAKITIVGGEKLPREGAYILAPNHHSEIDPVLVAVAVWRMGRPPRFMAKESLFRVPVLGAALRATGMIPVARSSSSAAAAQTLRTAEELVEHGRGVIVYPEGTLTRDPQLWPMRGKSGAVRLAAAAGIPIIPMAQWGAQEILPRYGKLRLWPPRRRIVVSVGDPIDVAPLVGATGDRLPPSGVLRATDAVMARISELLAGIRGIPAPAERWNPTKHGQKETGRLES